MATETTYICDGCGTEESALTDEATRESQQWGKPGIPAGWLELTLVEWGEAAADPRRSAIHGDAVFHSVACAAETLVGLKTAREALEG